MNGLGRTTTTIDDILDAALEQYNEMMQDDSWLGVKNKARETAFHAKTAGKPSSGKPPSEAARKPPTCFNCGQQGHVVPDCKKPLNRKKQEEMRAKFRSENATKGTEGRGSNRSGNTAGRGSGSTRKGPEGSGSKGKFVPPSANENGFRRIQVRDGVHPHKWNPSTKKWDRETPSPLGTVSTMTSASGSSTSTSATQRAAIANLQRTMQQSVQQTFATLLSEAQE